MQAWPGTPGGVTIARRWQRVSTPACWGRSVHELRAAAIRTCCRERHSDRGTRPRSWVFQER